MAECNRHAVKNDPKPEPSSSSLNSSLDPVEALRYSELSVSSENLRVFDNLMLYDSYVRRGGTAFDIEEEKREIEARRAAREKKARFIPPAVPVRKIFPLSKFP